MKRLLFVTLVSVVVLTACGGSDDSPPPQSKEVEVTRIIPQTIEVTRIVPQTVVVTRIAQVVVTATPKPPTRTPRSTSTPRPTSTPSAPEMGSRANPIPFDKGYTLVIDKTKQLTIGIGKMLRGEEAMTRLLQANQFNSPPRLGREYLMILIVVEYQSGPSNEPLNLGVWDFKAVSRGKIIDPAAVVEPDPEFNISFFPGASGGGWATFEVLITDPDPLVVIGMDYAGRGGFYFATHP